MKHVQNLPIHVCAHSIVEFLGEDVDVSSYVNVVVQDEQFPPPIRQGVFAPLFKAHALEVAGREFKIDYQRYYNIEKEGRLVWVSAYNRDDGTPIGYASGFIYSDLHFSERVAVDDLWFVLPAFRNKGLGFAMKNLEHRILKEMGALRVYDTIRANFYHPGLMRKLGFDIGAYRWVKEL